MKHCTECGMPSGADSMCSMCANDFITGTDDYYREAKEQEWGEQEEEYLLEEYLRSLTEEEYLEYIEATREDLDEEITEEGDPDPALV